MRWLVNTGYQIDCLFGCLLTGVRNKTISAWLGQCRAGRYGLVWKVVTYPTMLAVDGLAWELAGQRGHCADAAVPYSSTLNSDD